ncbi:hypothetical protein [Streptomyces sp. NPDC057253]|uniref:hypothetical protein n=1 Tax=Streptomyces sp. NPDC057253 TaxID=3346069 RepID=UPI00363E4AD1
MQTASTVVSFAIVEDDDFDLDNFSDSESLINECRENLESGEWTVCGMVAVVHGELRYEAALWGIVIKGWHFGRYSSVESLRDEHLREVAEDIALEAQDLIPVTHDDDSRESLVGRVVAVRPYYHEPSGPGSFRSKRSPFTARAEVKETFGDEMVVLRFLDDAGPWRREGAYFPRELHNVQACKCPACTSGGIDTHQGA